MQPRSQHPLPPGAHGKGLRTELSDYDEALLLDRSYVHTPPDGWVGHAPHAITSDVK